LLSPIRQLRLLSFVWLTAAVLWSATAQALSFTSVTPGASPTPTYEPFEIDAQLDATFDNPYDTDQIDVRAVVTLPDRTTREVMVFWFEPYTRSLVNGTEVFTPTGPGSWKLRYAPMTAGAYSVQFTASANGEQVTSPAVPFAAVAGPSQGFVRVNAENPRYFVFDGGAGYVPLGFDVCWTNDNSGDYSLMAWYDSLAAGGGNWTRLWLTAFGQATILEWNADQATGYFKGLGWYAQQIGAKLDALFAYAAQKGIYVDVAMHQHSQFQCAEWSSWSDNPFNAANGGPCATSADYFTNPDALAYETKLHRYIVARYSAYRSIMAWELFNEVDLIQGVQASVTDQWQRNVAAALRQLDPAAHLIATSYSSPILLPYFDLTAFDFNNRHQYVYGEELIGLQTVQYHEAGRPVVMAEFGIGSQGPDSAIDPLGVNIHNAVWSTLMYGYAGGAMSWWWDVYIDPDHLWGLNQPPAAFLAGEDLAPFTENVELDLGGGSWQILGLGVVARTVGKARLLGWIWDRRSDWFAGTKAPPAVRGLTLKVAADGPGECSVEFWNSWTGVKISAADFAAHGAIELAVPDFTRDIAFKLDCAAAPDDDDDDDDNDDNDDDNDDDAADDDQAGANGSGNSAGCGC
jgi:hypothetical protein